MAAETESKNYIKGTSIFAFKNFINWLLGAENAVLKQRKNDEYKFVFYIESKYITDETSKMLSALSENYNDRLVFVAMD